MKKNKLLAPLLGLATVATAVIPMASCSGKSESETHVKIALMSEQRAANGKAQFLLKLDSSDYDKDNFTITLSMSEKDKSGATISDFETPTFTLDGDHMAVNVNYINEDEPFEEDTQVRLMINVKYGSLWTESLEIKFDYAVPQLKGEKMEWDLYNYGDEFDSVKTNYILGDTYIYSVDLSEIPSTSNLLNGFYIDESASSSGSQVTFENIYFYLNGALLTQGADGDYTLNGSVGYYSGAVFTTSGYNKLTRNDVVTVVCENCTYGALNAFAYFICKKALNRSRNI